MTTSYAILRSCETTTYSGRRRNVRHSTYSRVRKPTSAPSYSFVLLPASSRGPYIFHLTSDFQHRTSPPLDPWTPRILDPYLLPLDP